MAEATWVSYNSQMMKRKTVGDLKCVQVLIDSRSGNALDSCKASHFHTKAIRCQCSVKDALSQKVATHCDDIDDAKQSPLIEVANKPSRQLKRFQQQKYSVP